MAGINPPASQWCSRSAVQKLLSLSSGDPARLPERTLKNAATDFSLLCKRYTQTLLAATACVQRTYPE